jgi:alpha-glucosidase
MHEASTTGIPALRPLVLEYPDDPRTYGLDDQFFFGGDLLVAPVLREAMTVREVYLPKGDWYDFWSGRLIAGGTSIRVPVTLSSLPIFVRAGAFVFRQPVVQHTGEMPGQPLQVTVYPSASSERWLYEDDGATPAYEKGAFARRRFSQKTTPGGAPAVDVEVGAPEGSWRPAARDLILSIGWSGEPKQVTLNGAALARLTAERSEGWSVAEGLVTIRVRDRFDPIRVRIE